MVASSLCRRFEEARFWKRLAYLEVVRKTITEKRSCRRHSHNVKNCWSHFFSGHFEVPMEHWEGLAPCMMLDDVLPVLLLCGIWCIPPCSLAWGSTIHRRHADWGSRANFSSYFSIRLHAASLSNSVHSEFFRTYENIGDLFLKTNVPQCSQLVTRRWEPSPRLSWRHLF